LRRISHQCASFHTLSEISRFFLRHTFAY
jgi:hypothetical protein